MVGIENSQLPSGGPEATRGGSGRAVGALYITTRDSRFQLTLDALAADDSNQVLLLSAAGPQSTTKALAALLQMESRAEFNADAPGFSRYRSLHPFEGGYHVYRHRLGYNSWHFLCVARCAGLLPGLSEAALWRELSSDRYTTPVLRSWTPWLMEQLEQKELLKRLACFNCHAGILVADTNDLDQIVTAGLSNQHLHVS